MPDRPVGGLARRARALVRRARVTRLRMSGPNRFSCGADFAIGKRAQLLSPSAFTVADRVRIGADFLCEVDAVIGPDTLISSRVAFVGNDHPLVAGQTVFAAERSEAARVVVDGDNLIGHGTIVIGNICIGRGAIIGAGSLVTKDMPSGWVCYGRPAVPVTRRSGWSAMD